jgi:N-acetylglucosaminyl-diphospho-decaprenol L-rhamnosyltransferase
MPGREITLSVVSHRQNALVNPLLEDVQRHCADRVRVVVTENLPDPTPLATGVLSCPSEVISNTHVRGFAANHNAVFARSDSPYFCVCNPDIRLPADPFPALLESLADRRAGAVGPLVRSPEGSADNSARKFPTMGSLLKKFFVENRAPDYATDRGPLDVDWIGGMFMLLPSAVFRAVGGFDEGYFLYYEDVDLCRRLHAAGNTVIYNPRAQVVHDAQRGSRRQPRLALLHAKSMLRFLTRR